MKKLLIYSVPLLLLSVVFAFVLPPVKRQSPENHKITWITIEEAMALNAKEPRKFLIDVYTDWCGWCKKMDNETFINSVIAKYVNEKFYAVKFNAEQKEDIVIGDQTYKFVPQGNRGYHELAAALMNNRMSYPTIVYLDENMTMIQPIPGYQTPVTLEPIIKFIGSDAYKTTKWEDFQASFKAEVTAP